MSVDLKPNVAVASSSISLRDIELMFRSARESDNRVENDAEKSATSDSVMNCDKGDLANSLASPDCVFDESDTENVPSSTIPLVRDPGLDRLYDPETGASLRLIRQPNPNRHSIPVIDDVNNVEMGRASATSVQKESNNVVETVTTENESESQIESRIEQLIDRVSLIPAITESERAVDAIGGALLSTAIPKSDLSENPSEWLPVAEPNEEKRKDNKDTKTDAVRIDGDAFKDLSETVLDQFPLGASSVVAIAGADSKVPDNRVAFQLATHLSSKNIGKVLLIDSHLESRALSVELGHDTSLGFADLIALGKTLDETICETDISGLDFLPVGTEPMCKRRNIDQQALAELVQQLKNDYQFVIVAVGEVFHIATTFWANQCDATYLALELNSTNQVLAQSSVVRLQQYGARLMGCVVTDVAA